MRFCFRRPRGVALCKRHDTAARAQARDYNSSRKLKELLAQQRIIVVGKTDRTEKRRAAVLRPTQSFTPRAGLDNHNVRDL